MRRLEVLARIENAHLRVGPAPVKQQRLVLRLGIVGQPRLPSVWANLVEREDQANWYVEHFRAAFDVQDAPTLTLEMVRALIGREAWVTIDEVTHPEHPATLTVVNWEHT